MTKVNNQQPTKILFIDGDEISFQFQKCMAQIIQGLPTLELFFAADATEGLAMLDSLSPDVIILEHEDLHEQQLFLDSLSALHPPVLVQSDEKNKKGSRNLSSVNLLSLVNTIPRSDTLEGIHQKLILAARLGSAKTEVPPTNDKDLH